MQVELIVPVIGAFLAAFSAMAAFLIKRLYSRLDAHADLIRENFREQSSLADTRNAEAERRSLDRDLEQDRINLERDKESDRRSLDRDKAQDERFALFEAQQAAKFAEHEHRHDTRFRAHESENNATNMLLAKLDAKVDLILAHLKMNG